MPPRQPVPASCLAGLPPDALPPGDTLIMQKDYYSRHLKTDRDAYPKLDRVIQRQLALARYRQLKILHKSQLKLDDQLFIENFEAIMLLLWRVKISEVIAE